MTHIKVMNENLANKIAAGEVIEKVMNVVKELVENSIDAGSSEIKIDLLDSGVREIIVTDNGSGMSREDAKVSFLRHATSKLINFEDLFHIESLGFRGEALPSIASVSKVELKTSDGIEGTLLELDGGVIKKEAPSELRRGTTIRVSNLFYNTPVRLKYLKHLNVELSYIVNYINNMALTRSDIKFVLTNNNNILLNTSGDGELLKVIHDIYGVDISKRMIAINGDSDDYDISGYISYPEVFRSNRNSIITFVNGRYVKNNELNRVIIDVYHKYMPPDKYPVVVLNIYVDPILVDINIHPQKMDIKFSKFLELKELVIDIFSKKLSSLTLIPEVSKSIPVINRPVFDEVESNNSDFSSTYTTEEVTFDFEVCENDEKVKIKEMIPVGLVHGTYIIAENSDGMFLIDQHAAAERINYEKVMEEMTNPNSLSTNLIVPISIELPTNEFIVIKEKLSFLESLNFKIEEFGINTLVVREHPLWIPINREKEAIVKIFELLSNEDEFDMSKFVHNSASMIACKMSIKANRQLGIEDMTYLLNTLRECENPFNCPHGRPVIITYSKYELERLFKRVMD